MKLKGKKILHINATRQGGGVAEMLQSLIPALQKKGLNVDWFVPEFPEEFFAITKKFHNALQGLKQEISLEEIYYYLEICKSIEVPEADLYYVHDPQCLALPIEGTKIWRCHIETTQGDPALITVLLPYINQYDAAIWTDLKYIPQGVDIPVWECVPCIDLLALKNQYNSGEYAIKQLGLPCNTPIVGAVSRFDPHKGQEDLIKAFIELNHSIAHLVILGNFATDDPEGGAMYTRLRDTYCSDSIHIRAIDDPRLVGSLMSLSDIFVHPASKEGFGLVVSEALNQGTAVIATNVGGIPKQVLDRYTGWLLDSPVDINELSKTIGYALSNPDECKKLGEQGRKWVQSHFTLDHLIQRHLELYRMVL